MTDTSITEEAPDARRDLRAIAADLAEKSHGQLSTDEWLTWLEAQREEGALAVTSGKALDEDVNGLLRSDPHWAGTTVRLPSDVETAIDAIGWFDDVMHASRWFEIGKVSPEEAARLLCQSDPLDPQANPELTSNGETTPADFAVLRRVLADVAADGTPRNLTDWIGVARARGCKVHSWLQAYIKARATLGGCEGEPRAAARAASPSRTVHRIGRDFRRDALWPSIELAISMSTDPDDIAEVWAHLQTLAEQQHGVLRGATEDGLQYLKEGEAAYLTRKNLTRRLKRSLER